jgi:hypothetical protein
LGKSNKDSSHDPPPFDRDQRQRKEPAVTIGAFREWELVDNSHDPVVLEAKRRSENKALNKAIDDLDMMFLPSVAAAGIESGRNSGSRGGLEQDESPYALNKDS